MSTKHIDDHTVDVGVGDCSVASSGNILDSLQSLWNKLSPYM